ncbi:hypothetical protein LZ575_12260 [Antarcticibacterium sp. 1MA-6-2]|uniref:hypothetical protein n=1 Tax=Antarcticibacterium sp. 1MA-6-2 TaxID=2908210 RepID=UPI001F2A0C10|nr:hypothetical protein [Antarcticibacterium sp. 1MA-6-2]UJH89797.1 hypothetical protein LZ575_12260 [Antarcticibacterium sp. 1MA-6-2]
MESTNFYLAIWDQGADGELTVNNFKARYGCGEPDLCSLSVGDPEVSCVVDGIYSVTVPIDGVNAQYSAIDLNALTISEDICLGNIGEGGAISGSFVLTYNEGTNYNIDIVASGEPTLECTDPFNPTQCTGNVQGTSPVTTVVTAGDESVCIGNTVQLSATPSGGTWSGDNVSASGLFDAAGLTAGPYEVTYTFTDNTGCSFNDVATVTVVSSPDADELEDVTACDNYTLPSLSAVINTGQEPEVQGHNCLLVM